MAELIYILLGLLLAGNVLTALFRWLAKRRSAKNHEPPRHKTLLDVLAYCLAALDLFPIAIAVLVCFFFCLHWYDFLSAALAGLLVLGLLLGLMLGWFTKKRFLLWLVCALAVSGAIWGSDLYERHLREISMPESFNYRTYAPFQADSPVKTLDEPSSLRFEDPDALPRMDGATALYPVYAAFAQATYPEELAGRDLIDVLDLVSCSTTAAAYRRIVEGDCDIIFVAGPSKEQEDYAARQGVELVYTPIGREAFVFFVHPGNPVEDLSLEQLRGIYAGEITRWKQLGVRGLGKILAFQRSEGSGSQTALERFVMGDTPLMPAETENVLGGMGGIVEQVSSYKNHRNAIGYSFRFYCTGLMRDFDVKLLAVNGVAPTVENIENGSYPLSSSFYAVTRADADENTLALLAWICSPQGQALVEKSGYAPLGAGD